MTCEDEVSEAVYDFLIKSKFKIISWDPPGGKKYFTKGLRIPLFKDGVRIGRDIPDLILCDDDLLILCECKCKISESKKDIEKLRMSRDSIGLKKLEEYFRNQGAELPPKIKHLVLSLGVRNTNQKISNEFLIFNVDSENNVKIQFGEELEVSIREKILRNFS